MKKEKLKERKKHMRNSKGITLIALIITIVILLILAVVAIRAVTGDGIIAHAKNARDSYQQAQENEEALLQNYLEKLGEDNNQNEEMSEEDIAELDLIERYVLGAKKTGRPSTEIVNLDPETMAITSFIDEESTIADASTSVTYLYGINNDEGTKTFIYTKYNNKAYKTVTNLTTYMTESVELVYKPEGREGTTVQYDSNGDGTTEDWIIITDRDGKVEIVSADTMYDAEDKALTFGSFATSVTTVTVDLDGDGTIGDSDDIAITSYNNAITRINDFCNEIVTATDNEGVRSVGASTDTAGVYSSTNFNLWFKGTNTVKVGDVGYEEDFVKMIYWGISQTSGGYWIASRSVMEGASAIGFGVRCSISGNSFYKLGVWSIFSDGSVDSNPSEMGVRPVVINPTGI